ncbi:hypothetical protein GWN63_01755, partial [Candidatus Bathyarchaeota archaeon]|nr:hypothetical protein [Candidatus Bathyarchaeota archaeon]NIR12754.1 hypothetical protein [Desulfobacterales bacterium]NIU80961.1 hypothetical protein [Candidatus Bathyarchaeota archaeon]NIV67612.1 hypothetical protein [Candidatus Bathyarchaeota archaeon]NIW34240.1 hypothetical protein [Candidatus Bathyarchaeota archaeon]
MDKKLFLAISLLIFLSVILAYLIIDKEYFGADHDIAIIRVRVSKTGLYLGEAVDITVIARNEGDETETFNVTSYYNLSIIETQTVSGLATEEEVNLTFSW